MTIDFWGLGLQAANVLILVWLLAHVFWAPLSRAIAARQAAQIALLETAQATRDAADTALAEVEKARKQVALERESILSQAAKEAEVARAATLAHARDLARTQRDAAARALARNAETATKDLHAQAAELSVEIAAKLVGRFDPQVLNEVFLTRLTKSIAQLTVENRTALFNERIDLVSACDLTDQARTKITAELAQAFDIAPDLNFVTDSDLIAGLEMQTPHFALRNSWHADLATILGDLKHDV